MKISIIYHSFTGSTRAVAEKVSAACGGKLTEVKPKKSYSTATAYTVGIYRAMKGVCDPIEQKTIDVSSDDIIVIGTPVWLGRPTPVINAAVAALGGCKGKKAVIFATYKGRTGEVLSLLKKALEDRGVIVVGEFVFDQAGVKDQDRINAMIAEIKSKSA